MGDVWLPVEFSSLDSFDGVIDVKLDAIVVAKPGRALFIHSPDSFSVRCTAMSFLSHAWD